MKKVYRIVSLLICLYIFIGMFNVNIIAEELSPRLEQTEWKPSEDEELPFTEGDLSIIELEKSVLSEKDIPEVIPAEAIEEKAHVNRVRAQEDLYSVIYQNRDATKTMYQFSEPIKYIDEKGEMQDKSNKITNNISNLEYASEYDYVNVENDVRTYLPKTLNPSTGVVLQYGKLRLEISPINGMTSKNATATVVETKNVYDKPKQTVEYIGAFGEETKLCYTPTFNGFKEDIILSKYTGMNEFSFRVETGGLSLIQKDGSVYLLDPLSGEIKSTVGELLIYDSAVNIQFQTEYKHSYKVETVKADSEYILTIVVDERYLKDETRVWPVTVDPSFSVTVSGSGTSKTIQDVPIYTNNAYTAYGEETYNYVGNMQSLGLGTGRVLMKFPGLTNHLIFKGFSDKITNISLYMYNLINQSYTAGIKLHYYTGATWKENTATCNSSSWFGYGSLITSKNVSVQGQYIFNLTGVKDKWQSAATANKGIMLINSQEGNSLYYKAFSSTDASNAPYISVTWDSAQTSGIVSGGVYRIRSGYNRYLRATSVNTISQNVKQTLNDAETAKQLWHITYENGYYYIENLGIYTGNYGAYPSMLYTNSSGQLRLSSGKDGTDNQKWIISKTASGSYCFMNKAFPQKALSVISETSTAYLTSSISCVYWQLEKFDFDFNFSNYPNTYGSQTMRIGQTFDVNTTTTAYLKWSSIQVLQL